MQRPTVTVNISIVAKRSSCVPRGIPIGLSVSMNNAARPTAKNDHATAVCDSVARNELMEKVTGTAADAPMCFTCGTKMRPAGSCYLCEGCGSTSGCS